MSLSSESSILSPRGGEDKASKSVMSGRLARRIRDLRAAGGGGGQDRRRPGGLLDERTHLLRAERSLFRSLRGAGADNPDACDASGVTEEDEEEK